MAKFSCIIVSALVSLAPRHARAAQTLYFPHADERYLFEQQRDGAAALLAEDPAPGVPVPLVVFLHGTNSTGEPHLWLGGGGRDVRPVAARLMKERKVRPLVLAGPSQTKAARVPRALWSGFDLDAFVDDVVTATRGTVDIDRRQVVVAGHSGAGCNPFGGLATPSWSAKTIQPLAVASIDQCLDAEMGRAFSKRPAALPLLVWWQSAVWPRDAKGFWTAVTKDKPAERVDRITEVAAPGTNPHDTIVPLAFESMLRELFPYPSDAKGDDAAAVPH